MTTLHIKVYTVVYYSLRKYELDWNITTYMSEQLKEETVPVPKGEMSSGNIAIIKLSLNIL